MADLETTRNAARDAFWPIVAVAIVEDDVALPPKLSAAINRGLYAAAESLHAAGERAGYERARRELGLDLGEHPTWCTRTDGHPRDDCTYLPQPDSAVNSDALSDRASGLVSEANKIRNEAP